MSRSVTKVVAQHRLVTFAGDILTFVDWHKLLRTSSAWAEKESKAQKSYTNNARGSLCRWRTTAINKRHVLLYINKILKKEAWLAKCPSSTNYINGWSVEWKKISFWSNSKLQLGTLSSELQGSNNWANTFQTFELGRVPCLKRCRLRVKSKSRLIIQKVLGATFPSNKFLLLSLIFKITKRLTSHGKDRETFLAEEGYTPTTHGIIRKIYPSGCINSAE